MDFIKSCYFYKYYDFLIILRICIFYKIFSYYNQINKFESIGSLNFEYFHFFYLGEKVNWKEENTIKFSYEKMSIYHNSTVVIANENKNSKYLLYTGKLFSKVYCPEDSHLITNSTYTIIPNVIVGKYSGFGSLTHKYDTFDPPNMQSFRVASYQGSVSLVLDDLIAIGHQWGMVYGHFVMDILAPMLFIPKDVRCSSKLLLSFNTSMHINLYKAIGFRDDQFVYIEKDQFIYAHKLHTVFNCQPIHGNNVYGMRNLGNEIKRFFHAEEIQPFYLGLQNRKINTARHITNFDDFIISCQNKYGKESILILPDTHPSLSEAVQAFSSLCILFGPSGSNFANMMYMKEGCGVVIAMADMMNGSFTSLAICLHIWCVAMTIENMSHFDKGKVGPLNISTALLALETVEYAVTNQK